MGRNSSAISDEDVLLLTAPGIGAVGYRRLIERFGDAINVVRAGEAQLQLVDGIGTKRARALAQHFVSFDPDAERKLLSEHNAQVIVQGDADYPALLAAIPDPPPALWVKGELCRQDRLSVAIVGSRNCTTYGREQASRFSGILAQCGLTIVSGGALGIDAAAHRGTLQEKGRTIAVFGCGLARTYPPDHLSLFESIAESDGALISEFPMATEPRAQFFPRRNRIISGLSLGVLIIEAAEGSGALITGRCAAEDHNREVMCVPGRVDSPASRGCLLAIREGWAAPVIEPADVITQLDSATLSVQGALALSERDDRIGPHSVADQHMTSTQQQIVDTLADADEPILIDQLCTATGLAMSSIMAEVTMLQIRGRIKRSTRGIELRT